MADCTTDPPEHGVSSIGLTVKSSATDIVRARNRTNRGTGGGSVHLRNSLSAQRSNRSPARRIHVQADGRGTPLAAMHKQLTLSVCKRRDAVRLALHQPARPAGAAFGVLSGATVSWAAPMHRAPFTFLIHWACYL